MAAAARAAPGLHDPLEALQAAHDRIENNVAMLERLASHVGRHGADPVSRQAAGFVLRFFETAGREHQRDEDGHLFPLLRAKAAELDRPEVSAVMNEVQADHEQMDAQWSRIGPWLHALAGGEDAACPASDVEGFAWLQRRHMAKETALILPFAREVLA